jgi:hypothetical protein
MRWGTVHVSIFRVTGNGRVFHNAAVRGKLGWDGTLQVKELRKMHFLLYWVRLYFFIRGIRY